MNYIKDSSSSTDINMESVRMKTLMSKEINKNANTLKALTENRLMAGSSETFRLMHRQFGQAFRLLAVLL